jgi:hypothetical protein
VTSNTHSRSYHLAGDLRAGRQSPKQKVTGTGAGTGPSDSFMGLRTVDGTSEIDRACHRNIRLFEGDPRSRSKVWEALDREIGKPGENRGQIVAHWEFQP